MFCAVRRLLTITLPQLFASQSWLGVTGNIYWSWWHIVWHKTSGRVSNAWTGPILLVHHNNVEGKYWWHCWNRNGFGPSPPEAIRAQTGRKLRENWKWHKVWTDPGHVRPPTDHQYQSRASHNRNKLPRSQNLIQTDRAVVQGQRRNKAALLARMVICLAIDCFSEVTRVCRRLLGSLPLHHLSDILQGSLPVIADVMFLI